MKRELIPGMWGRCGRAIPDPQASELDNATPMRRCEDYHQGRNATNKVSSFSMLAGEPVTKFELSPTMRSAAAALGSIAAYALLVAFAANYGG